MTRNLILDIHDEIIVDNFAGGGGASTGIYMALGRHVDIAVNHDAPSVALHSANHPQTRHFCEDVFTVDPRKVTNGRIVSANVPEMCVWRNGERRRWFKENRLHLNHQ